MSAALDSAQRRERIARLNDMARQAMGVACIVVATEGFQALPDADQSRVRELIETFDAFGAGNDAHGERDFGAIYHGREGLWTTRRPSAGKAVETVFWKIDCYDRALCFGSEDPADPAITRRVLTIMLASEY